MVVCYKRPQNLRDTFVKADVGSTNKKHMQSVMHTGKNATFPCLHCVYCSNVIIVYNIQEQAKKIPVKGYYTCDSSSITYLLKCPCGLIYVGEASQHIKDRITRHKFTVQCNKTWLPVSHHFSEPNHSVSQLRLQVIETIPRPRRGGNHIKMLKNCKV